MKNSEQIEPPVANIERSVAVVLMFLASSALLSWFTFYLFSNLNPWGFMLMVPTAIICFQTLWLLLNPFALVFKDRVEIKRSLFSNKLWYFIDIKRIAEHKNGKLYVVYHDDEVEPLNLRGIKNSNIPLLRAEIEKSIFKDPR